jgi:hypothetical protein
MARIARRSFAAWWFGVWLWLFAFGIAAALGTVALGLLPQMIFLGWVTLASATLGAAVCLAGIRLCDPVRWRATVAHWQGIGESLRNATEAIGEPRRVAYAPVSASADRAER